MARKSSKTAHVMNLLAGGEAESSKSEAAKENLAASQAAESNGTIKELTVLAQQASIQMQDSPLSPSPISIIDLSSSVQDPVAELIKQQLEEDEKMESETGFSETKDDSSISDSVSDSVSDTVENPAPTVSEEVPVTEQFNEPSDNSTDVIDETDMRGEDDSNDLSISDTDEQMQMDSLSTDEPFQTGIPDSSTPIQTDIPDLGASTQTDIQDTGTLLQPDDEDFDESEQTDIQDSGESAGLQPHIQADDNPCLPDTLVTDTPSTDAPATPAAPTFKYLNVMEHVVENIARDYMERLGGCTCEHCIADVTALTLNKLSPKYVVVEPPAASPLLNFYSSRFAPQVIVELTKSCFIVKENPHH